MTDVLIGQSYFLRFDPKLWDAQQPYAPLGALYAAAGAREHGYVVAFFDAMLAQSIDEWHAALDRHRPRIAVLYEDSFNYLSKMCLLRMRDAALAMIDAARARGIPVMVAGSDGSDHAGLYLDRGAEAVIAGEADVTLLEALDVLSGRRNESLSAVPGLCLRGAGGGIVRTPAREFIRDLDRLPRPAWDLVDVERYRAIWQRRHGYFSMNVTTTRGCPYHCNWCAKPIYGQRYTVRSAEQVAEEIAWLRETYRPDHVWFVDDIFGLKPGWVERFGTAVAERHAVTPFKCLLRADGVTDESARTLAAAGCRTAWIGAESGSQRILDAMEKGIRVEQISRSTRSLHAAGIDVGFFLQFGYPGETLDDIERTLQMVRDSAPDDIGISVSYPLPGTTFYDRVNAQLGEKRNWIDSNDLAVMYRATYDPEFYRTLHQLVHAEFRIRRFRLGRATRSRLRAAAAAAYDAMRIPWLTKRLKRLSRLSRLSQPAAVTPLLIPVLSPHAAAVPSEQPH
jgi:anaerobic magnesium-protoporphyrin IX monomethyl ester cyclase